MKKTTLFAALLLAFTCLTSFTTSKLSPSLATSAPTSNRTVSTIPVTVINDLTYAITSTELTSAVASLSFPSIAANSTDNGSLDYDDAKPASLYFEDHFSSFGERVYVDVYDGTTPIYNFVYTFNQPYTETLDLSGVTDLIINVHY